MNTDAPETPVETPTAAPLDPIQASLREQSAIVQQGPAHRRIHRREVQPDGAPKSNPTLRRRAGRTKE